MGKITPLAPIGQSMGQAPKEHPGDRRVFVNPQFRTPDWEPDPLKGESSVPSDLAQFLEPFKGRLAYICPTCKYVFPPSLAGMPGSFRAHLHPTDPDGNPMDGCRIQPRPIPKTKAKSQHLDEAKGF